MQCNVVGINESKLKENGFEDIWGFYLAEHDQSRQIYKNINNISGNSKF